MWHLRNYPTRRKLLKDVENLRAENRHLSIELRNARTDLALEKKVSSGYRHENRELKRKLKAYESSEPETIGQFCAKMRGEYPFTLDEALRLKSVLQTDLSIEDLFGSAA